MKDKLTCRCSTTLTKFECPGYDACVNLCVRVRPDNWGTDPNNKTQHTVQHKEKN